MACVSVHNRLMVLWPNRQVVIINQKVFFVNTKMFGQVWLQLEHLCDVGGAFAGVSCDVGGAFHCCVVSCDVGGAFHCCVRQVGSVSYACCLCYTAALRI